MMIECPKCHEMNGQNRDTCWKCGTRIQEIRIQGMQGPRIKICTNCRKKNPAGAVVCSDCGQRLTGPTRAEAWRPKSQPVSNSTSDNPKWMYAVAVLLPLIGIILGCIYISKDERDFGQSLIKVSVIVFVVCAVIAGIVAGCAISEANRIMSSLQ